MDKYTIDESQYKNGYAKGYEDGKKDAVKHGRWEDTFGGKYANPRYRCSACKGKSTYRPERDILGNWKDVQALTDYCPNCGARMDGTEDGN